MSVSTVSPESQRCPSCAAPVPADAVICTNCGLNLRTGEKLVSQVGKPVPPSPVPAGFPAARWLALFAGLALLLVACWCADRLRVRARAKREAEIAQARAEAPPERDPLADLARQQEEMRRQITEQVRPLTMPPPVTDAATAAGKAWTEANETITEQKGALVVKGRRFLVRGTIDGMTADPYWPLVEEYLTKTFPGMPLEVDAGVARILPGGAGSSRGIIGARQANEYWFATIRLSLQAKHPSVAGNKPIAQISYEGETPKTVERQEGLSPQDAGFAAGDLAAMGKLREGLPLFVAKVVTAFPEVLQAATPQLTQWLTGDDPDRQRSACAFFAAAQTLPPTLAPLLGDLLGSEDQTIRMAAMKALEARGEQALPALPQILPLLGSDDQEMAERCQSFIKKNLTASSSSWKAAVPYLVPTAEKGGHAARLWLVRQLFNPGDGESVGSYRGPVVFAALAAEQNEAERKELAEALANTRFPILLSVSPESFATNGQLASCLALPDDELVAAAIAGLVARQKAGKDIAEAIPALAAIASEQQLVYVAPFEMDTPGRPSRPRARLSSRRAPVAWRLLAAIAAEQAGAEALAEYGAASLRAFGEDQTAPGWVPDLDDLSRMARLAAKDDQVFQALPRCLLARTNPFAHRLQVQRKPDVPAGATTPSGALALLLSWDGLDKERKEAGLKYILRGIESKDDEVSVTVAWAYLAASEASVFLMDRTLGPQLSRCQLGASKAVIAGLDAKEIALRHRALWTVGTFLPAAVWIDHTEALAQAVVDCVGSDPDIKALADTPVLSRWYLSQPPKPREALQAAVKGALAKSAFPPETRTRIATCLRLP